MLSKKVIGGVLALVLAYYLSNRNCCSQKKEGKTVETKSGSVRGIISLSRDGREYYEWLGIPYAKPPVGSLRFASPQPLGKKWDGVLDGSAYGSVCAQVNMFQGNIVGQEDCLFLNIHTPKVETRKLLPVMFFIHGGYFVFGSADQYKPQYFMDEDVLLVTINYRLAALGFLSTGDASIRGNMGLKDQSLALKWIKENIANFGGDPNQITIFGESAGSASVHFQMLSPKSQGLMQRAISQSGTATNPWAMYDDPASQAKTFAGKLNCPLEPSSEMAKCLRNVDIKKLLAVHLETMALDHKKETIFVPTVETIIDEETFLPDHPTNLYKSGKIAKIPWLTGFNADEGLLFAANILTKEDYRHRLETDPNFVSEVGLQLNPSEAKSINKIIEFYFGNEGKLDLLEKFTPAVQLLTDRWFSYAIQKTALAHSQYASTQLYYYNKTGPSLFDFMVLLEGKYPAFVEVLLGVTKKWFNSVILGQPPKSYGVCHGDELVMMFDDLMNIFRVAKGDPNYEFSKDLVKTWVSFASTKNVEEIEFRGSKFPLLSPKGDVKVIEINDVPAIKKLPVADRLRFWDSL